MSIGLLIGILEFQKIIFKPAIDNSNFAEVGGSTANFQSFFLYFSLIIFKMCFRGHLEIENRI